MTKTVCGDQSLNPVIYYKMLILMRFRRLRHRSNHQVPKLQAERSGRRRCRSNPTWGSSTARKAKGFSVDKSAEVPVVVEVPQVCRTPHPRHTATIKTSAWATLAMRQHSTPLQRRQKRRCFILFRRISRQTSEKTPKLRPLGCAMPTDRPTPFQQSSCGLVQQSVHLASTSSAVEEEKLRFLAKATSAPLKQTPILEAQNILLAGLYFAH